MGAPHIYNDVQEYTMLGVAALASFLLQICPDWRKSIMRISTQLIDFFSQSAILLQVCTYTELKKYSLYWEYPATDRYCDPWVDIGKISRLKNCAHSLLPHKQITEGDGDPYEKGEQSNVRALSLIKIYHL